MESEDELKKDNPFEEREKVEEVSKDEDGESEEEGEYEEGEEGEDEEEEEEECALRFEGEMSPLDFVKDGTSQVQLYQQFERLEYEALEVKKHKITSNE